MFVEKLTKKDVKDFIAIVNISNDHAFLSANFVEVGGLNTWFVKFRNLETNKTYTISFTDFNVVSSLPKFKARFKAFMVRKFGEEYKKAFNKNLKQKYKEEMIK